MHISSNFFSSQNSFLIKYTKFEKWKALKKALNEELMSVAWHSNRWWDWCMSEDEKKEINRGLVIYKLGVLKHFAS